MYSPVFRIIAFYLLNIYGNVDHCHTYFNHLITETGSSWVPSHSLCTCVVASRGLLQWI